MKDKILIAVKASEELPPLSEDENEISIGVFATTSENIQDLWFDGELVYYSYRLKTWISSDNYDVEIKYWFKPTELSALLQEELAEKMPSEGEKKIITSHDHPPIPDRRYDWSATREDYDEGDLIGYGRTEQESIDDLIEKENNQ